MGASKLSKGISFPVKRMEFEAALGAEVLEVADLSFRESPTSSNRYAHELLNSSEPIKIARVYYSNKDWGYSAPKEGSYMMKFTGERESIDVYPVRSSDRAEAHTALMLEGVRLIKEWLGRERPETWRTGRHTFELWWDPFSKKFETKTS